MAKESLRKIGDTYYYDFTIDGKRYRGTTKTGDKKFAEQIASTIKTDVLRKKHTLPREIKFHFIDLWDVYLQSQMSSIERKVFAAKHFLQIFKDKPIASIAKDQIENYQLKRKLEILSMPKNKDKRESEIAFRSVNIEIGTLRHFFNFCIGKGYIDKNPAAGIKKLNELSRNKILSDSDIDKLIAGATNKIARNLIAFLVYTGCRKGEALNLKWDDVDLQNGVIAVKATKTKYDRYIPIHTQLKAILSGIERNHDSLYVFERSGAKLTDFRDSFHTACRNAGLNDLRIHDLRHVFASKMVMNGTPLYTTGALLGHKTPQMTQRYAHLSPDTLKKAVNDVWNENKTTLDKG